MRILLVDDSKTMRMLIRRTLRQAGYETATVEECGTGEEALTLVGKSQFDLIVSDWNMPAMSGPELVANLRKQGDATPVGFITTENTEAVRQQAHEMGARFLVAKPFTPESLSGALQKVGLRG